MARRDGDHHLSGMKNLELSDEQEAALIRLFRQTIDADKYPLSPRLLVLKEILAKLRPEPGRPAVAPQPRVVYAPPSKDWHNRRR